MCASRLPRLPRKVGSATAAPLALPAVSSGIFRAAAGGGVGRAAMQVCLLPAAGEAAASALQPAVAWRNISES